MSFALGQRWISDTESELGLGVVVAVENRNIAILFPAINETRMFAKQDVPLTRVIYNVNDEISTADGITIKVTEVVFDDNETVIYVGINEEGNILTIKEILLECNVRFNKPQDRLFNGQVDKLAIFNSRYISLLIRNQQASSHYLGLIGPKVGLISHQLWIAHEIGSRYAPRVLLADEVGLGKTIEAGLILHQQLQTGRASRVLIIVPETLQHQWLVEMLRRFNLRFSLFDDERCKVFEGNAFSSEQLIICNLNLFTDDLGIDVKKLEQALAADFDLLIVDEAHHLEWSQTKVSSAYQIIESLAQSIPGLLLLTATPDQLGHEGHFARLRLLDHHRFFDYKTFMEEEEGYRQIAKMAQIVIESQELPKDAQQQLTNLLPDYDFTKPLNLDVKNQVVQELIDRHGTGRILFRNTRSSVAGFPKRNVIDYKFAMPIEYETTTDLDLDGDLQFFIEQRLRPELSYQVQKDDQDKDWYQFDPRIDWLIKLLKNNKDKKFLIICAKAKIALQIEECLRVREGILSTVFHGGMSIIDRDKASAYFSQEKGAQALICSEIGSEGRNFQFASDLIMFDLPLNPDLLEQRIGRLDRIGQKNDVTIHVPYFVNTVQEYIFLWFNEGLNAFNDACASGYILLQEFKDELYKDILNYQKDRFDNLIEKVKIKRSKLQVITEQGRDRLLELNSSGMDKGKSLINAIKEEEDNISITKLMSLWNVLGVEVIDQDESMVLRATEHMLFPSYPGLDEEGVQVTFERDLALVRDDLEFITYEHPLVQTGLDLILSSNQGTSSIALLKNRSLPVGTLLLETIFVIDPSAPKSVQIGRYLAPTPIRLLLDKDGNNLGEKVTFENLNKQLSKVNPQIMTKLIAASKELVVDLIAKASVIADDTAKGLITNAIDTMQQHMDIELRRLTALQKVNSNIRNVELDYIIKQTQDIRHYLDNSQLQLDSVRLILVSHV